MILIFFSISHILFEFVYIKGIFFNILNQNFLLEYYKPPTSIYNNFVCV